MVGAGQRHRDVHLDFDRHGLLLRHQREFMISYPYAICFPGIFRIHVVVVVCCIYGYGMIAGV